VSQVAIKPLAVRKVNPGARVLLQGGYTPRGRGTAGSETMTWTQVEGENIMKYPEMISIQPHFSSLAIREGVLQLGQDYRLRFSVRDGTSVGFAEVAFRVNTPPSSGRCSVAPSSGYSDTVFELQCKDWVDEADDLPLNYEFRYMLPSSPDPTDEVPLGTLDKNVFSTGLPAPPTSQSRHPVVVVTYIIDQSGGGVRAASNAEVLEGSESRAAGAAGRRMLQALGLAKLDGCVATGNVECIIQLTISVAESGASGGLQCSDKTAMIERLRSTAAKMRMNKVEVAGFSTAVRKASDAACNGRRSMASSQVTGSLDLVSSLVDTSKSVGLEGLAAKGIGHSLSSALGGISTINTARRRVRSVVQHVLGNSFSLQQDASAPAFMRRNPEDSQLHVGGEEEGAAEWEARGQWARRSSTSDVLLNTLTSLSASQLGGAVEGEDSSDIDSPLIKMSSKRSSAESLNGAVIAPAKGSSRSRSGLKH
jgi:hypothetical protein